MGYFRSALKDLVRKGADSSFNINVYTENILEPRAWASKVKRLTYIILFL